jgi:seryl-tRNA synthetase|tara:strand:- start:14262 stop:15539 length:1278 start_codon:yes stop_codon:yes gene_type:complete
MIDIKLLRENPEIIKDSQRKRGADLKTIDHVISLDKKWRDEAKQLDGLKHERNQCNEEIARLKKSKKDASAKIKSMQKLAKKISKLEQETENTIQARNDMLSRIPNILHDSVPPGETEQDSVPLKHWGKKPVFKFKPQSHVDLGLSCDIFDIERAAKTSGARFYFMKNAGVQLELALVNYTMDYLRKAGFTLTIPPNLVRKRMMYGSGMLPLYQDEIYKIQDEDLYLILTSEHALCGLHSDEVLEKEQLPLRYCGLSQCYRTEAGAHGRDQKGIFRVHQFEKVEMFSFSTPEKSWEEHDLLLKHAEKLIQNLKLPYRVTNICTADIGTTAAKKYDIEVWFPGQEAYRELISCSNCTDYQARRLNTRYHDPNSEKPLHVHTLNSTAMPMSRAIVAIMENYQTSKGSIKIPKVLQPYMGGLKEITPK